MELWLCHLLVDDLGKQVTCPFEQDEDKNGSHLKGEE
jgi:hypothetical protein